MKVGRQVERFRSADGKHLLRLFSRGEGCFYFVELSEITENGETFWTTTQTSPEFSTLQEAKHSAAAKYAWLKEVC
ncbi:MAG: hypothetical protein JO056_01710 [Alphaproteobacteria bacterium]|jgi:hypothetical protein|nr:hypothetical protein [Alphaproteobacteria bacterium]